MGWLHILPRLFVRKQIGIEPLTLIIFSALITTTLRPYRVTVCNDFNKFKLIQFYLYHFTYNKISKHLKHINLAFFINSIAKEIWA